MIVFILLLLSGLIVATIGLVLGQPKFVDWVLIRKHHCATCSQEIVDIGRAKLKKQIDAAILDEPRDEGYQRGQ